MQRTTNHLLAYLAGEPLTPHWRECEDEGEAWRNFISFTSAALRDFHVRVELETIGRPQPPEDTTLYTAAMLQLVNDLAANETVHHCANEACGRPFVRQLGRSTYGGHRRTGTLYCTSNCKDGRPLSTSTVAHVHRTFRKALTDAVRVEQVLATNPAERAKLPRTRRGEPGTVWTTAQLAAFLHQASTHRLSAFFRLAATPVGAVASCSPCAGQP